MASLGLQDLSGETLGLALAPFVMIPSWLDGWLAQNEARKKEKALFQVGGGRGKEIAEVEIQVTQNLPQWF